MANKVFSLSKKLELIQKVIKKINKQSDDLAHNINYELANLKQPSKKDQILLRIEVQVKKILQRKK